MIDRNRAAIVFSSKNNVITVTDLLKPVELSMGLLPSAKLSMDVPPPYIHMYLMLRRLKLLFLL